MRSLFVALSCCLVVAGPAHAQRRDTTIDRSGLPRDVAREATTLFNEMATVRATERLEIEQGRTVEGDVAVLDGPVIIGGVVRGRVLAINSDVVLRPSARIEGDLLVVGGEVEGRHAAYVGGEIRIYRQQLQYTRMGDRLEPARTVVSEETGWWRRLDRPEGRSGSKLFIASAGAYNRLEGLPINIGPRLFRNDSWGSARLDAFAVVRTETSFTGNEDDLGHDIRTEVKLGRRGGLLVGGRAFNVIEPTETWQLSDLEAGLAAFVMRRDYRDYWQRHGGQVSAGLFVRRGAEVSMSYGNERWLSRPTQNPWTVTRQRSPWRPNPAFDEGRVHLLTSSLRIDTRNDSDDPWSGWFVVADVEHGFANMTQYAPRAQPVGQPSPPRIEYARGFLDLRRYNRLSPDAQLNLRLVTGGWLSGDPLPLQRRFGVDGPGALPGYDFRAASTMSALTCTTGAFVGGLPAQCDRMALAQVEYRGDLHFDLFTNWDDDDYMRSHSTGVWVFFADAGRGWLVGPTNSDSLTYAGDRLPPLSTFKTDIGVGLDFDIVGAYVAKAMSAPRQPANFFVRIKHRF